YGEEHLIISKKSVAFILGTVFFMYLAVMMLYTYLPQYLIFIGTEPPIITLTMTFAMSTFFIFPPLLGRYSDKLQNRIYFIFIGPFGMLITLALLLFTRNIIILNILIFIFGFFTSSVTIYLTLFSELVQNDKKWISYYNSVCAIGNFIGVIIGGILIDFFNIENLFLFALIMFLSSIVFNVFIRENRQLILDNNIELSENIHNEGMKNILEEDNISKSIYYGLFFRNFAIIPILNIIVIIMGFYIPNNTEIAFLVGINPLFQVFIMLFIGKKLNQKNIKTAMILGFGLSVIVIIGYIISVDFWSFLVFQVLVSLSYSLFWIAITVYIAQNSTPNNKGRFMGYATSSIFAGTTLGGLFFSLLLAVFHSNYYISMSFMIIFPIISTLIITLKFKNQ
ncbi:MAG: MFS transporter, partial [Candidatus Lokiarchaeota archaeon]|nr:MFS transporter [Candidatus Lokiarchaeota archaeon]